MAQALVDPPKAHWDFRDQSKLAGWIEKGADLMRGVANHILNVQGNIIKCFAHFGTIPWRLTGSGFGRLFQNTDEVVSFPVLFAAHVCGHITTSSSTTTLHVREVASSSWRLPISLNLLCRFPCRDKAVHVATDHVAVLCKSQSLERSKSYTRLGKARIPYAASANRLY